MIKASSGKPVKKPWMIGGYVLVDIIQELREKVSAFGSARRVARYSRIRSLGLSRSNGEFMKYKHILVRDRLFIGIEKTNIWMRQMENEGDFYDEP